MEIRTYFLDNLPPILRRCADLGYAIFTDYNYDLNLIACRSPSRVSGVFDDVFHVIYRMGDRYIQESYPCTTDAGLYWMHNPSRVEGTAILVAGQYRGVYKLDLHAGKYLALCQRNGSVSVYRDNNRDDALDMDPQTIQTGRFGINIHRAHSQYDVEEVGRYSAGCVVIKDGGDFDRLIALAKKQRDTLGYDTFSLTLLED
jgi:hypothetical protein